MHVLHTYTRGHACQLAHTITRGLADTQADNAHPGDTMVMPLTHTAVHTHPAMAMQAAASLYLELVRQLEGWRGPTLEKAQHDMHAYHNIRVQLCSEYSNTCRCTK